MNLSHYINRPSEGLYVKNRLGTRKETGSLLLKVSSLESGFCTMEASIYVSGRVGWEARSRWVQHGHETRGCHMTTAVAFYSKMKLHVLDHVLCIDVKVSCSVMQMTVSDFQATRVSINNNWKKWKEFQDASIQKNTFVNIVSFFLVKPLQS